MPKTLSPIQFYNIPTFNQLWKPIEEILPDAPPLDSGCNKPLELDFEHQLKALIFYHLEEHTSGRHLIQTLHQDEFAREVIAPPQGIGKSTFFEANDIRGLVQLMYVFQHLQHKATGVIPRKYSKLGDLIAIDGSLIDACLSMLWADYRKGAKKAKLHLGFDINRGIPRKLFLTDGKGDERPFVSLILEPGQTGVLDRYYQHHRNFDRWQKDGKHFVCRIKASTTKKILESYAVPDDSIVFLDAKVLLGTQSVNQTATPVRLVGYTVDGVHYWVATDRFDLSAEQIALIYKLRWEIEKFFGWWKRHLRVYHLISRSNHGVLVQILSGLITYLLVAIYCHQQHGEKVSIFRLRELRNKIRNEARSFFDMQPGSTGKSVSSQFNIANNSIVTISICAILHNDSPRIGFDSWLVASLTFH